MLLTHISYTMTWIPALMSNETNLQKWCVINTHTPGQNGHYFADDISRCIFVNEKFCILIKISLKFVPNGPIDNNPALV